MWSLSDELPGGRHQSGERRGVRRRNDQSGVDWEKRADLRVCQLVLLIGRGIGAVILQKRAEKGSKEDLTRFRVFDSRGMLGVLAISF